VAAVRDDLEMVGEIAEVVGPYLGTEDEEDPDAMDVDRPKGGKGRGGGLDIKSRTTWAAVEAIVKGYNRVKMNEDPMAVLREVVLALESAAGGQGKALNAQAPCVLKAEFATIRRMFWYDCVRDVMEDAVGEAATPAGDGSGLEGKRDVVQWFFNSLDLGVDDAGTEAQRLARVVAAKATIQLGKARAGLAADSEWEKEVRAAVARALGTERSLEVQKGLRDCLDLLK
jgi:proteasome component ECM29